MKPHGQLCDSSCADRVRIAEREFSAFLGAVMQLYGPEAGRLAAEDWLDETERMDSPPLSICRNWRAVTIAAAARLANRLTVPQPDGSDTALMRAFDGPSRRPSAARRAE